MKFLFYLGEILIIFWIIKFLILLFSRKLFTFVKIRYFVSLIIALKGMREKRKIKIIISLALSKYNTIIKSPSESH